MILGAIRNLEIAMQEERKVKETTKEVELVVDTTSYQLDLPEANVLNKVQMQVFAFHVTVFLGLKCKSNVVLREM